MMPKEMPAESRVEQILDAALYGFGERGYHDLTMDDLVAASGLSKGTLYWYFSGKKDLFLALFRRTMRRLAEGWAEIVGDETLLAVEKVRRSVGFFRTRMEPMSSIFSVMVEAWVLTRRDQDVGRAAQEVIAPMVDMLQRIISQGMAEGSFRVTSPTDAATVIVMAARGLVLPMGAAIPERDWDRYTAAAEELALQALGATPDAIAG